MEPEPAIFLPTGTDFWRAAQASGIQWNHVGQLDPQVFQRASQIKLPGLALWNAGIESPVI